jgi:hypothetical protein
MLAALSVSMFSCHVEEGDTITHKEFGLTLTLPKTMDKKNVEYADICFFDGRAEVFAQIFDREKLNSIEDGGLDLNPDITVEDYAERFVFWNEYKNVEIEVNESGNVATFFAYPPEEYFSNDVYYHVITRNYDFLYVVIMCCDKDVLDEYRASFIEWGNLITLE